MNSYILCFKFFESNNYIVDFYLIFDRFSTFENNIISINDRFHLAEY